MKNLIAQGFKPIDSLSKSSSGENWTFKEKLFLGLSPSDYFRQAVRNPYNWILGIILVIGLPIIGWRFWQGLGAVTHSSNDYPWGLFLGFGLFTMVPLSASGFLMGTTVELFGRHDFKPILRLALLNGLLGYGFAVVYLLNDLGSPWRLYYPMFVAWGTAAVLFLVGWHVATYLSVQIMEISESFFEWMNWPLGAIFIKRITIGLTVAGIILSTLHQGALGALFTYAPSKVHPLWYQASFQWIFFFVSSIYAGLCMVILVSTIVKKTMVWRADREWTDNLDRCTVGMAKGATMALITYFVIKVIGLAHDNEWGYLFTNWGILFLVEIVFGVVLPFFLLVYGIRNLKLGMIRFGSLIAVLGIVMNRLDTALVVFNYQLYREIPHKLEIAIAVTVFAIYLVVYRFILYRLPILFSWKMSPAEAKAFHPFEEGR